MTRLIVCCLGVSIVGLATAQSAPLADPKSSVGGCLD